MQTIKVLFFASLREAMGTAEVCLELKALGENPSIADLREHLITVAGTEQDYAELEAAADRQALLAIDVVCALNQSVSELTQALAPGDEVAFFPPVTGG